MTRLILFSLLLACCLSCQQRGGNSQETTVTDTVFVRQPSDATVSHTDTVIIKTSETPGDHTTSEARVSSDQLIIPGESIGKTPLGMNAAEIGDVLGKPDRSDAAMGKAWLTWYGKSRDEHNNKTELDIYTTYKDNSMREKTVQQIRVTSSFFKTSEGVGVYNSLADIRLYFPGIKEVASYKDNGRVIRIYDDVAKGISFDVAEAGKQLICTGITVHLKGKPVAQTYIYLHPGTELL